MAEKDLEQKLKEQAEELAKVEAAAGEAETLRKKLNETTAESIKRKEKIRELEASIEDMRTQLAERSGDATQLVENLNAKLLKLSNELAEVQEQKKALETELAGYKENAQKLQEQQKAEFAAMLAKIPEEQRAVYADLNPVQGIRVLRTVMDTIKAAPVPGAAYGGRQESAITREDVLHDPKLYKEMKTRNPGLLKKLLRG